MRSLPTELFACSLIRGAALADTDDASDPAHLTPADSDLLLLGFGPSRAQPPTPWTGEPVTSELVLELSSPLATRSPGPIALRSARLAIGRPATVFRADRAEGSLTLLASARHAALALELLFASPRVDTEGWGRAKVFGPLTVRNHLYTPRLDEVRTPDDVITILQALVAELRPAFTLAPNTPLSSLGLSSLDLYRFAFEVEDVFGIEVSGLDPDHVGTLSALAAFILAETA